MLDDDSYARMEKKNPRSRNGESKCSRSPVSGALWNRVEGRQNSQTSNRSATNCKISELPRRSAQACKPHLQKSTAKPTTLMKYPKDRYRPYSNLITSPDLQRPRPAPTVMLGLGAPDAEGCWGEYIEARESSKSPSGFSCW